MTHNVFVSIFSHLPYLLFWTRCPDGSHQLVRDAVPTDARQRVPQSGASAAGVSAGMRALKCLSSTRNTQLPPPSFDHWCPVASRISFRCYFWFHVFLKCFPLLNSIPYAHCFIIGLCQLENTEASSGQTAKLSGHILTNEATVKTFFNLLSLKG